MICNSCEREFDNIDGSQFCPYCGEKIIEASSADKVRHDTLEMPIITNEIIKKYNKNKFFIDLRNIFTQKRVALPIVTIFFIMLVLLLGYKFLIAKPVDIAIINKDLIGKIVTLPMGTKIEIKKNYIKGLSISSRNIDKTKNQDDIKVSITLNNGAVEVKTLIAMIYINKGRNKWEFNGKVSIIGDADIKPVVGMDEKQLTDGLKKLSISISDESIDLNEKNVKSINLKLRTPDFKNGKEQVLLTALIDSGFLTASGDIKCNLNFKDEKWNINTVERNSTKDFALGLSPSFDNQIITGIIKSQGLQETVTYKDLFGGKSFDINDIFTKSINTSNKKFDGQNKTLSESVKRENVAGEIKLAMVSDYTFSISFNNITFVKRSDSTVLSSTVNEISNDSIIGTITNSELAGSNMFLWFPTNHKITAEEAKTFNTDEILSKKGFNNIKYVYGSITYMNRQKQKTVSVVALYSLVYDSLKGYNWQLDKIISEDSPNYNAYSKVSITK